MTALTARAPGAIPAAEFLPYIHGATLGRPSRGRPERVLARLKTIGSIWREDHVPGEDGREGRVTARGALPRSPRNGLPEPGGYVYRGGGESLTAWAADAVLTRGATPGERPAPRRRQKPPPREFCRHCGQQKPDHLVTCRTLLGPQPIAPPPEPEPEPAVLEAAPALEPERHRKCGYPIGSVGHKIMCGDG